VRGREFPRLPGQNRISWHVRRLIGRTGVVGQFRIGALAEHDVSQLVKRQDPTVDTHIVDQSVEVGVVIFAPADTDRLIVQDAELRGLGSRAGGYPVDVELHLATLQKRHSHMIPLPRCDGRRGGVEDIYLPWCVLVTKLQQTIGHLDAELVVAREVRPRGAAGRLAGDEVVSREVVQIHPCRDGQGVVDVKHRALRCLHQTARSVEAQGARPDLARRPLRVAHEGAVVPVAAGIPDGHSHSLIEFPPADQRGVSGVHDRTGHHACHEDIQS